MTTEMNRIFTIDINTSSPKSILAWVNDLTILMNIIKSWKGQYVEFDPCDTSTFKNEKQYLELSNTIKKMTDSVESLVERHRPCVKLGIKRIKDSGFTKEYIQEEVNKRWNLYRTMFDDEEGTIYNYLIEKYERSLIICVV